MVGQVVVQLTKLVKHITMEKKEKLGRGLDGILGQAEGVGSARSSGSTRSKAAALRSLQTLLRDDPKLIHQAIEGFLLEDWRQTSAAPGVDNPAVTARGWLEHRSRIQNYQTTVRFAWCLGGIWGCLRQGRVDAARARAALKKRQLAAGPRSALGERTSLRRIWTSRSGEASHSRLLDSRVELYMHQLKDLAEF